MTTTLHQVFSGPPPGTMGQDLQTSTLARQRPPPNRRPPSHVPAKPGNRETKSRLVQYPCRGFAAPLSQSRRRLADLHSGRSLRIKCRTEGSLSGMTPGTVQIDMREIVEHAGKTMPRPSWYPVTAEPTGQTIRFRGSGELCRNASWRPISSPPALCQCT